MLEFAKPPASLPKSQTDNPYWDILRTVPGDDIDWTYQHVWHPSSTALLLGESKMSRNDLCGEYTWAIPDPMALEFAAEWLKPKAIEIGAGAGYWAWQLSQLGVDIIAYDLFPPQHTGQNHYHSPRNEEKDALLGVTRHVFFDVRAGGELLVKEHPDRTLFLCWPPMSDMALECLKAYKGTRLVYIGEGEGGCTADEAFFERLSQEWQEIASHCPVQWSGAHDCITVYERANKK